MGGNNASETLIKGTYKQPLEDQTPTGKIESYFLFSETVSVETYKKSLWVSSGIGHFERCVFWGKDLTIK